MFTAAQIRQLSQKLSFPGQDALYKAARREADRANLQAPTRAQTGREQGPPSGSWPKGAMETHREMWD